jgi:vacuolar protein sorting-associated protein IST1
MPSLSISPVEDTGKYQAAPQSPSSPAGSAVMHAATKSNMVSQEHHRSRADEISCATPSSSDVLEKARAAIAAANRASAAARAAADLVKVKITS